MIIEGKAKIYLPKQTQKISKEQKVFYNPAMRLNRDITILLLKNHIDLESFALPMAASGIRAVRIEKEVNKIKIFANDLGDDSFFIMNKNKEINSCSFKITKNDANLFLLNSTGFDYIDIDPFGSPNNFLNSAILRIAREGILAVSATDTAPLCGTYHKTCVRNYWATPIRNELMHEVGLRILIRKIQLIGAQFDKALYPVFSYYKDHYFRIFFKVIKSKTQAYEILKEHKYLIYDNLTSKHTISKNNNSEFFAGPLYTGKLFLEELVINMIKKIDENISKETNEFLNLINSEKNISENILYNLHTMGKKFKIRIGKTEEIILKIKKQKYLASKTHFNKFSIKTNAPFEKIIEILKT